MSTTDLELIQECFKLLTSVIENNESRNYINERQMKLLIEFIEQFALMSEKNVEALACLKVLNFFINFNHMNSFIIFCYFIL